MQIKRRELVVAIILSIVTCGIYGMYWMVVMTDDMNSISPADSYQTSGVLALVLTIITCGIYGIYWAYRMGNKLDAESGQNNGVLFLILNLFGLSIVTFALIQYELNKRADSVA